MQPVAVVDVDYRDNGAVAACAIARTWADAVPLEEHVARISEVEAYRPGEFFKRELPCVVQVLSMARSEYRAILIDGYVDLDPHGAPGLGGHLHAHYDGRAAVIGVAKTAYRGGTFAARVLRGASRRPLFVTARGIPVQDAARLVEQMHGSHRLPTLIKRVDTLARTVA